MHEKIVALCHSFYTWFKDSWFFGASQELAAGIALLEYLKRRKVFDSLLMNTISGIMEMFSLSAVRKRLKDRQGKE